MPVKVISIDAWRLVQMPRKVSLGIVVAGCALLAACGGSGATGYHNPKYPYGAPNVPISLSKCMRANGVSSFPDPRSGPDGGGVGWPGGLAVESSDQMTVMGQQIAGPALAHALKTCSEYLPPGGPGPKISESQRVAALAHAACMREHGISNFPDPTFNGGQQSLNFGPGLNPNSPAFERAAKACGLLDR
jgi:hypothetical protein